MGVGGDGEGGGGVVGGGYRLALRRLRRGGGGERGLYGAHRTGLLGVGRGAGGGVGEGVALGGAFLLPGVWGLSLYGLCSQYILVRAL